MGNKRQVWCRDSKHGCNGKVDFGRQHPVRKRGNNFRFAFPCDECGLLHWGNGKVAVDANGNKTRIKNKVLHERQTEERGNRQERSRPKEVVRRQYQIAGICFQI
jgi:hypothetical protein